MNVEFKEKKDAPNQFETREISAKDKLGLANNILICLWLSFLVVTAFLGYYMNSYGKFVFTSAMQLINTFGSFIMGHYFSRSK